MKSLIKFLLLPIILNGIALAFVIKAVEIPFTGGIAFYILGAIIIGLLNAIVKPIIKLISLPAIFFSAGLFLIVINAVIFYLFDKSLEVLNFYDIDLQIKSIVDFVLAGIVFGIVNFIERMIVKIL